MGTIRHFVLRINPTAVAAAFIASLLLGGSFALGMTYLAAGLAAMKPAVYHSETHVSVDNKGGIKGYRVVDGKYEQLK